MKKQYTKKQITEAIAYWEKQLKQMNENADSEFVDSVEKLMHDGQFENDEEVVNAFIDQINLHTYYSMDNIIAMYPLIYKLHPNYFNKELCDFLRLFAKSNDDVFFIAVKNIHYAKNNPMHSDEKIFFVHAKENNHKFSLVNYEVFDSYEELNRYLADTAEYVYDEVNDL